VNIGSDGGGAREQDESVPLQSQSEAPDCNLEGADVHDACKVIANTKISLANSTKYGDMWRLQINIQCMTENIPVRNHAIHRHSFT
jgi:hypothetical protein